MKQYAARFWASFLALALLLSMAACSGGNTTAASMHLRRAEGTVSVSDGDGKDVPVLDNLGLYSGYEVGTRSASYAWIDLDDVKLTKLDQNSEIAIQKEGKALDIEVKSGSLFFNVTEPLADDETMNIRTSTMLVGIRGTSGWVSCEDELSQVYILEGKVDCSAEGQTVQVKAGEYAELTADGELVVRAFTAEDVPDFVQDEVDETPGPDSSEAPDPSEAPEAPETAFLPEGEVLYSGEAGENVTWAHYSDGTLVIEGTGPMSDGSPWRGFARLVETVVIRYGVTSIGDEAFKWCDSLTGVSIPDSVTSIGKEAFRESGLTSVKIPDSVASIGEKAFYRCPRLASVTIPDSVTTIGKEAFFGCSSLTDIYYGGSAGQWEQIDLGINNDLLTNAAIHYNR